MRTPLSPFAFAVLAIFASYTVARADMGMPGTKPAKPTRRITTTEPHPDHIFIVYQPHIRYGNDNKGNQTRQDISEAEYVELTPDRPIVIPYDEDKGKRIWRVVLLIVPRATATQYGSALEVANAVQANQIPGAVQYEFPSKDSVSQWSDPNITRTYQVRRMANSDSLEVIEPESTAVVPYYLVCPGFLLALVVAIALFPLWWRRQKSPPPL